MAVQQALLDQLVELLPFLAPSAQVNPDRKIASALVQCRHTTRNQNGVYQVMHSKAKVSRVYRQGSRMIADCYWFYTRGALLREGHTNRTAITSTWFQRK